VATTLGLSESNVFPISAQKGLVAKIHNDAELLIRSRLPRLETALSQELIPAKQEIVRDFVADEMRDIVSAAQALLAARVGSVKEQEGELSGLRNKNQGVMQGMLDRVKAEKVQFERGLMQFSAIRSVLARSTNTLFAHLGMEAYTSQVEKAQKGIGAATFSSGMLDAMRGFFAHNRLLLETSNRIVAEITDMMAAMYQRFSEDFKLQLAMPRAFSMTRYINELDRVEDSFNRRFGALSLITQYERTLTRRFFDVVATRIQTAFEIANRDTEGWLKAVMNPLEGQIKERQQVLKRRLESLKRIHVAADTLEERIDELVESERILTAQVVSLDNLRLEIEAMLSQNMIEQEDERSGFDVSL
jgi:hypothetical protein